MNELVCFGVCLLLGAAARLTYLGMTALAKRADLLPVTVTLDVLTTLIVGVAFSAFVILSGAVVAPYMFASGIMGYFVVKRALKKVGMKTLR